MARVFAVSFLRATPSGVAEQIDANRARQIASLRPCLDRHRLTNAMFEIDIERRPACHRTGESSRMTPRHPARSIGKPKRGNAQPLAAPARAIGSRRPDFAVGDIGFEKALARHHRNFFGQRRVDKDGVDGRIDIGGRHATFGRKASVGHLCLRGRCHRSGAANCDEPCNFVVELIVTRGYRKPARSGEAHVYCRNPSP